MTKLTFQKNRHNDIIRFIILNSKTKRLIKKNIVKYSYKNNIIRLNKQLDKKMNLQIKKNKKILSQFINHYSEYFYCNF